MTDQTTRPIDLRSDTVTRPTAAMRRAMAEAEVGDDVYGEDPTVNRLEEVAAERLGFEASLFLPSGTMGNAIGIRLLTEPGEEVLADERSHVIQYELAGMAVLSGVMPRVVRTEDGKLTPALIQASLRPSAYYRSDLAAVVLENTHNLAGGSLMSVEEMRAAIDAAHEARLGVHVDGARLWNAAVALDVAPERLVEGADTVMVDLSKGLGCPVGGLIASSRERIGRARRLRKLLGGGMRQVGVLAAAGLVALDTMVERLAEDHAHARLLAQSLAGCAGVRVRPAPTNIVVASLDARDAAAVAAELRERGVLASPMDARTLRLVTHYDVSRADCERAATALRAVLGD
ncbi:MAG: low specificity L-threonine aldolase [Vicinamibacteria bacterium]